MPRKNIRIQPYGNTGNRMFQYMFADILRRNIPGSVVTGYDMPEWSLTSEDRLRDAALAIVVRGHVVPLEAIIAFARKVDHLDVHITTLSCRYQYYRPYLDAFRATFPRRQSGTSADRDKLVINIRLGGIATGAHPNYMPLPISWYEALVRSTGLIPVFVGQIDDSPYTQALRTRFPSAQFPALGTAEEHFDFIRRAVNIVPCISTFSWLAAWLAEDAQGIYFPIAGFMHPRARRDVDLLCVGDSRYRFFDSDLLSWKGTPEEMGALINDDYRFTALTHAETEKTFADLIGPAAYAQAVWRSLRQLSVGETETETRYPPPGLSR